MSVDFNNPKFGEVFDDPQDSEAHKEPSNSVPQTFVENFEHPLFTSNGAIGLINSAIGMANSSEQPRKTSTQIPVEVFRDIARAARSSRVHYDLLLFALDWKNGLDGLKSGSDANSLAKELRGYVDDLRNTLGRDPMYGEVFAAHVLKSASKVKELLDKAEQNPDEEIQNSGSDKPDITDKKLRNGKQVTRTNRELYDFFLRRIPAGRRFFTEVLGKDKT